MAIVDVIIWSPNRETVIVNNAEIIGMSGHSQNFLLRSRLSLFLVFVTIYLDNKLTLDSNNKNVSLAHGF
jgi:hypothetical protein